MINKNTLDIEFRKNNFHFFSVRTDNSWHSLKVPDCTKTKTQKKKYHRHPFDCSKYYKCEKSILVERDCPIGLQWNQINSSCERLSTCVAAMPPVVPPFTHRRNTKKKKNCDDDDDDDNDHDDDMSNN